MRNDLSRQGSGGKAMRHPTRWTRRTWVTLGSIVSLIGLLVLAVFWPTPDPWPARTVLASGALSHEIPGSVLEWGDGRLLVAGPDELVTVDSTTGRSGALPAEGFVMGRTFSGDRRHFVATAILNNETRQVVWGNFASGAVEARFDDPKLQVFHPTLEPDERSIRAFLRNPTWPNRIWEVARWDIATGAEVRQPITGPAWVNARLNSAVVSPDGRTMAYLDWTTSGVQLWDVDGNRPIGGQFGGGPVPLTSRSGVMFTPDGRHLVLCRDDGRAEVWGVAGTLVRQFVVHSGFRTSRATISPDGRILASGGLIQPPRSWPGRAVLQVRAFFPAAQWRAVHEVVLVDLATGRRLARAGGAADPTFAPDGREIATSGWGSTYTIRAVPMLEGR